MEDSAKQLRLEAFKINVISASRRVICHGLAHAFTINHSGNRSEHVFRDLPALHPRRFGPPWPPHSSHSSTDAKAFRRTTTHTLHLLSAVRICSAIARVVRHRSRRPARRRFHLQVRQHITLLLVDPQEGMFEYAHHRREGWIISPDRCSRRLTKTMKTTTRSLCRTPAFPPLRNRHTPDTLCP